MADLKFESSVTDRYQTTVPSAVRAALGLGQRDKIAWTITPGGKVEVGAIRGSAEHEDPALMAFLALLERDIAAGDLQPAASLFARMEAMVGTARLNLDAPLPDDDDNA
ncbi:MAG: type II toxin-antitoxin system PrlF family antitoxin [Alphaproteobacteria bacterium]|nr:type II toxin-antitoxin system PrlF family antitoxin [Alphaproteobacteria bacterium]